MCSKGSVGEFTPNDLVHPGEILAEEIASRGWEVSELADRAGLSYSYIADLILGKDYISVSTARGLSMALGSSMSLWLNLQRNYDSRR